MRIASEKAVFISIIAVLALFFVNSRAIAADIARITITYVKYPLNAPLIVAKHLGLYEQEFQAGGIGVDWADIVTGPGQAAALASGAVQIASVISSDAVLASRSRGEPVRAVAVFARAPRTFCIMAKSPSVASARDLKGRTVAGPKGTLMHLMLLAALERAGLKPGDATFVDMPASSAVTALLSGGVDAALAAGPGKMKAMAEGAREVACGEGLTKGIILTAVNEDFLKANPDLVRRYLEVHAKALAFLRNEPAKARGMIAAATGLTPEEVDRLLPEYDFSPEATDSDKADLKAVRDFLMDLGLISSPVDPAALFWP
ncbi:MAG: ABC transporter substrate-binding protein [Thermodesulfobacteriota bacterium]